MSNTDTAVGFLSGLLLGATAGLLVGLLAAPASGQETRRRWHRIVEACECVILDALRRERVRLDQDRRHAPVGGDHLIAVESGTVEEAPSASSD